MSDSRDPKFFVVGGPVQPGRDCYLQRTADAELLSRLEEGEYCHVLAQRQTGKTSLAASTASKLRGLGMGVAVVDLTQTSEEDPSENAGRWYYSIAYRIVRDLRIKSDLQAWWAERGGLTNLQRLREFFNEVVLTSTEQQVVVFFDRVEVTLGEPLAQDLFSVIRACYDARATDADFQRLAFVIFGSAAPDELVKNVQGSPFEISTNIALPDFSPQEMSGLMAGLGQPVEDEEQVVRRVWSWTRGHPYLCQKVFRGLARRKDELVSAATVDELVHSQFTGAQVISEESHLSAIAERMLANPGRTQRLNLYGRIRKGVDVMRDNNSDAQRALMTAGLVTVGSGGHLQVRNEIYAMVFDTRWVNQNLPYGFKGIGIAAAVLALIVGAAIWYTEYLPRPYVQALSSASTDYAAANDAYDSLRMLPGYGTTADRLFESFLLRLGQQAKSLPSITRISNRLADLPGREQAAQEQLAAFWERRAAQAVHQGERDLALIALLEALQQPNERRRAWAAELIGADYRRLAATLHAAAEIQAVEVDASTGLLTVLDKRNRADVWQLDSSEPRRLRTVDIIAEERLEVAERRLVETAGARPKIYIETTHPQPRQVEVVVRAPTGRIARLQLSDGDVVGEGIYRFDLAATAELSGIASEELAGNWSLSLTDLEGGVTGELLGWGFEFAGRPYVPAVERKAQPIPEPRLTENAESRLASGGRLALSWPEDPDTQGSVLVWDLESERVLTRIPRGEEMSDAAFVLEGDRVVTLEPRRFAVWDTATGNALGEIPLTTSQPLRMSPNRRYAAVAVRRQNARPLIHVWDLATMRRVGVTISGENAGPVSIDSAGRYIAVGGRDPFVRVWSLTDGVLVREFEHGSPLRSVQFDAAGDWLATDDLSSTFRVWNVREGGAPVIERFGISPWSMAFAPSGDSLIHGSAERSYQVSRLPDGATSGVSLRHPRTGAAPFGPLILPGRNLALTTDGQRSVKVWTIGAPQSAPVAAAPLPRGTRAVLNADGSRIATGNTVGEIRFHAAASSAAVLPSTGSPLVDDSAVASEVICLRFSGDGRLLASASIDGRVRIWDVSATSLREVFINHADGGAHDLVFIDEGERLVSASRREVLVTNLVSGAVEGRLRIQANHPQLAVATASGDIFIADDLNGVTLWNWRMDQAERIVDSDFRVQTVAVTPDAARMVTASDDGELTLWNVAERLPADQRAQAAAKVDKVWLLPEGRLLVQAGYWLQVADVFPAGLSLRHTRLLPVAPASVRPMSDEPGVFVLAAMPGRAMVSQVIPDQPMQIRLEGEPADLGDYWRRRLSLAVNDQGEIVRRLDSVAP